MASDRGFTLGDGAFETIRVHRGRSLQLDAHLNRLQSGLRILAIPCPSVSVLNDDVAHAIDASCLADAVVRVTISRGAGRRGLAPTVGQRPSVVISVQPFEPYPQRYYDEGVTTASSSIRRNEFSPLCRFKSLSQADNVLARMEAQRSDCDFALLRNTAGTPVCADCANLFVVRNDLVLTPSVEQGALPGATRAVLRKIAGGLGLEFREATLSLDDLRQADEILLTNVILEVAPVVAIDGERVGAGRPGPIGVRLRHAYRHAVGLEP